MGSVTQKLNGRKDQAIGPIWYVSGEETAEQIASRAERILDMEYESQLFVFSETHVDSLCHQVVQALHHEQLRHQELWQAERQQPEDSTEEASDSLDSDVKKDLKEDEYYDKNDDEMFSDDLISQALPHPKPPSLIVIDSIQTMVCEAGGSSVAGGVTQVRECVSMLLRLAKSTGIPIWMVGHVTKSGDVAGPRTVEHMVDSVLYLESGGGSGSTSLRILRASKNRFGSSDEIGVYEMTGGKLLPVADPSSLFLAQRNSMKEFEGSAIALAMEGMRALTVEVQALVVATGSSFGRRTVDGIAQQRLLLIMGVLLKRAGIMVSPKLDVYINIVGRMRLDRREAHAADLALAMALVSSLQGIPVRSDTAFVGEIGLLGELRPVQSMERRLQEAKRMGFSRVVSALEIPVKGSKSKAPSPVYGIEWVQCETALDALQAGLSRPLPKRRSRKARGAEGSFQTVEDLGLEIMDDDENSSFL